MWERQRAWGGVAAGLRPEESAVLPGVFLVAPGSVPVDPLAALVQVKLVSLLASFIVVVVFGGRPAARVSPSLVIVYAKADALPVGVAFRSVVAAARGAVAVAVGVALSGVRLSVALVLVCVVVGRLCVGGELRHCGRQAVAG